MVENYCFIHNPTFIQTCRGESPGAADSHSVAIFGLPRSGNMPNLTAYVASNSSLHGDLQHCQQERKGFGWIYKLIICDYFVSFGKDISKSTTILNTLVTHCTSTCTNSCFIERQKILKTR